MKCIVCGCSNSVENPVTKDPDPYQSEIYDDNTDVWECVKCRQELRDEI